MSSKTPTYSGDVYYYVDDKNEEKNLIFPPDIDQSLHNFVTFTSNSIGLHEKPLEPLKLTNKVVVGSLAPGKSYKDIKVFTFEYIDDWKNNKAKKNILWFIDSLKFFQYIIEANEIPRDKGEKKYSTKVYKASAVITGKGNSKESKSSLPAYSPPEKVAAPGASNNDNTKVGATVIPQPSTRGSATKPSKTSASGKPSDLKRGRTKQSAARFTSRSVSQNIDPPQRIRDRSSEGENIIIAQRCSNPCLIVKLPVTSPNAFSSSTGHPPKKQVRPSNPAKSAPNPSETRNRSSSQVSQHRERSLTRAEKRKCDADRARAESDKKKKELSDMPGERGSRTWGGKKGFVYLPADAS